MTIGCQNFAIKKFWFSNDRKRNNGNTSKSPCGFVTRYLISLARSRSQILVDFQIIITISKSLQQKKRQA